MAKKGENKTEAKLSLYTVFAEDTIEYLIIALDLIDYTDRPATLEIYIYKYKSSNLLNIDYTYQNIIQAAWSPIVANLSRFAHDASPQTLGAHAC